MILSSDRVSDAQREGGISQTSQVTASLTGINWSQGDNNWRDQCNEIASQTNFADYSMARRLILIKQQEAAEDMLIIHMDVV